MKIDELKVCARRYRTLMAVLIFLVMSIGYTWPLCRTFGSAIGGWGDSWMLLWNIWHTRDAILSGHNPFTTDLWYYPKGVPLIIHALGLPNAVLGFLLWPFMSPVAVYNTLLLATFVLAGAGMYLLLTEIGANWFGSMVGGMIFAFCPYHLGHSVCHLDLASIQWIALWLWLWTRSQKAAKRWSAVGAGIMLAVSVYAHFYFGPIVVLIFLGWGSAIYVGLSRESRRRWLLRSSVMCVVAVMSFLPLAVAVARELCRTDYPAGHDSTYFSTDMQAFFLPGEMQWFARPGDPYEHWTATRDENMAYIGYAALALTVVGAVHYRFIAPLLLSGLIGAILALGPRLHIGGGITETTLPFDWLQNLPILRGMGVPSRYVLCMYVAIAMGAGLGAAFLLSGRTWKHVLAACLGLVAVVEYWPRSFVTSACPQLPASIVSAIRKNGGAVLDLEEDERVLWNQMQHKAPIFGGRPSRLPRDVNEWYSRYGAIDQMRRKRVPPKTVFMTDAPLAWDWQEKAPIPGMDGDYWKATFETVLPIPVEGDWTFGIRCDDRAKIYVDDLMILDTGGVSLDLMTASLRLGSGRHGIKVLFEELCGKASIEVLVRPPDGDWDSLRGNVAATYECLPLQLDQVRRELTELGIGLLLVRLDRCLFFEQTFGFEAIVEDGGFALFSTSTKPPCSMPFHQGAVDNFGGCVDYLGYEAMPCVCGRAVVSLMFRCTKSIPSDYTLWFHTIGHDGVRRVFDHLLIPRTSTWFVGGVYRDEIPLVGLGPGEYTAEFGIYTPGAGGVRLSRLHAGFHPVTLAPILVEKSRIR